MPYTIFSPEILKDGTTSLGREYPWGQANVMDPAQSNFAALRNAVIGEFASVSPLTHIGVWKGD
jgi:septin family protein